MGPELASLRVRWCCLVATLSLEIIPFILVDDPTAV